MTIVVDGALLARRTAQMTAWDTTKTPISETIKARLVLLLSFANEWQADFSRPLRDGCDIKLLDLGTLDF
jgi:hypothetical protein